MTRPAVKEIERIIGDVSKFAVTSHRSLDGDAVGSEAALLRYLSGLGKSVLAVNGEPTPRRYQFLDPVGEIVHFSDKRGADFMRKADVIFILDTSSWDQLGEVRRLVRESPAPRICIDHHIPGDLEADQSIIEPSASSTGELIYGLLAEMNAPISREVAEALFVAVAADTGWFRFSNADAGAYALAAELVRLGASPDRIYEEMYEKNSLIRVRLLGATLSGLQADCGGRVVWFALPHEAFARLRADESLTEGVIDYTKLVEGAEVSIAFKEIAPQLVRISFRSRRDVDVQKLARTFGGGGHERASGAEIRGNLDDVIATVLAEVRKLLPPLVADGNAPERSAG